MASSVSSRILDGRLVAACRFKSETGMLIISRPHWSVDSTRTVLRLGIEMLAGVSFADRRFFSCLVGCSVHCFLTRHPPLPVAGFVVLMPGHAMRAYTPGTPDAPFVYWSCTVRGVYEFLKSGTVHVQYTRRVFGVLSVYFCIQCLAFDQKDSLQSSVEFCARMGWSFVRGGGGGNTPFHTDTP